MDLANLLDNCTWYDKWQYSADLYMYQKHTDAE